MTVYAQHFLFSRPLCYDFGVFVPTNILLLSNKYNSSTDLLVCMTVEGKLCPKYDHYIRVLHKTLHKVMGQLGHVKYFKAVVQFPKIGHRLN